MLVPDEVIALISRAEYESLWENYKKGFKKGWEKATELYKMQLNAIIMKLKMPQKEVKESEIGDIEELEEEQEEEGEETEEGEDEETDMANVARRSNKKPAVKARVKKTWTPPPNVKEFLKWSKRDYDLQRQEIFTAVNPRPVRGFIRAPDGGAGEGLAHRCVASERWFARAGPTQRPLAG